MEDKLLKVLRVKIDAVNKNIDNLNYLNGELEKNNNDLEFINEKIDLFKNDDILNFDNIGKEEFNKILSMVNPGVSEVFNDKTCNYDGIIYIIEGIRKSISLQLTSEQTNAILTFIEGLKAKANDLNDVIKDLTDNKERLPETDLNVLNSCLEKYQDIVSKFENNLYLSEIDEIGEALNFAASDPLEKADVYEYLLKYNAEIYNSKVPELKENPSEEEEDYDLPDLNTVNVSDTPLNDYPEEEIEKDELSNIKIPTVEESEVPKPEPEIEENTENEDELNTVELEDIIQKIDAKLKEMESGNETSPVEEPVVDNQPIDVPDVNGMESVNVTPSVETPIVSAPEPELPPILSEPEVDTEVPAVETNQENEMPVEPEYTIEEDNEFEQPIGTEIQESEPVLDNEVSVEEPMIETEVPTNEPVTETPTYDQSQYSDIINKYGLYGINITGNSPEEVGLLLNGLNSYKILEVLKDKTDVLSNILSKGNSNSLNEIASIIKENLILKPEEFDDVFLAIAETMPILLTDKKYLDNFKENINFYKERKLNIINLYDNYRQLLIMNHDVLINNYNQVVSYGLEVNSDNIKYLLDNMEVAKRIDSYIEALGFEKGFLGKEEAFDGLKYIKENPHKINNISRDTLIKLRYSSETSGKIYGNKPGVLAGEITNPKVDVIKVTPEYLNNIYNLDYGFIDRSEIESLKKEINNLKVFDLTVDNVISKLDGSYMRDALRYVFDNVIISRIKTIRIYNFLKNKLDPKSALLIALTYNSVLKTDEYSKIENVVNVIVGGGN